MKRSMHVNLWLYETTSCPYVLPQGKKRLIARENLGKLCLMHIFMSLRCGYVQLVDTVCYAGCVVAFVQCTLG